MRNPLFLAITTATLLAAGGALADNTPQATTISTSPDAKICKIYYHEGMLIRTHCMTQAQWDSVRHYNQQQISDFQLTTARLGVFR